MSDLIIAQQTIRINSDGLYCLNDLHKAAGGLDSDRPKFWLALPKTQEFVNFLEGAMTPLDKNKLKARKLALEQNQILTVIKGGKHQGTYACKKLVYHYAMWLSAEFNSQVIDAFDDLVMSSANYDTRILEWKKLNVLERPSEWRLMFTEKYYTPLMRMFGWKFQGNAGGLPAVIGYITLEYVYRPIMPTEILEEIRANCESDKIHQWFSTGGKELISEQIMLVSAIAKTSTCYDVFKVRMGIVCNNDPLQLEVI